MAQPSEVGKLATQRAEIDGANNIVVQIEGDRNTVNLKGLGDSTLTRFLNLRRIDSDYDLMQRKREIAAGLDLRPPRAADEDRQNGQASQQRGKSDWLVDQPSPAALLAIRAPRKAQFWL